MAPKPVLTVTQPEKIGSLLDTLNLIDQMSERIGEDKSGDMGGSSGQAQVGTAGARAISPRDQAIADLPAEQVMQTKLAEKIRAEVGTLRSQIRSIPGSSQPGAAFRLNKLYARIRLLNRLLANLFESSVEVIKRLFIRVFIDEQPIL
ncbi:MAG: hypothetical protein PHX87_04105 [Candidatus Peribacteraceae bacterium]|nr:hypothetical protein [Candidatus Peribacteraceae bacterium]MDD5742585.1 hypothetical protein [Candidatus Peribacteraceae bacterium]